MKTLSQDDVDGGSWDTAPSGNMELAQREKDHWRY